METNGVIRIKDELEIKMVVEKIKNLNTYLPFKLTLTSNKEVFECHRIFGTIEDSKFYVRDVNSEGDYEEPSDGRTSSVYTDRFKTKIEAEDKGRAMAKCIRMVRKLKRKR